MVRSGQCKFAAMVRGAGRLGVGVDPSVTTPFTALAAPASAAASQIDVFFVDARVEAPGRARVDETRFTTT